MLSAILVPVHYTINHQETIRTSLESHPEEVEGLQSSHIPLIFALAAPPAFLWTAVAACAVLFGLAAWFVFLARTRAIEARLLRGQMRNLHELTRRTLEMNLAVEPGAELAKLLHEIFALEAVVLFDADLHQTYQAGKWSSDPREMVQNVFYFETSDDAPSTGLGRRVLRLGSVPIGSMIVRGHTAPLTNDAMAALVATTFDRYRASVNENQIETERKAEQLRSTVLDSLAHAYKTPLTAIRAASTGLVEMGRLSPAQSELVSLIDEQAALLSELTTRLLTTAQLDTDEVALAAAPVGIRSLIDDVVFGLKERLAQTNVAIQLEDDSLELCCDRSLMTALLTQYVDNACKYSFGGTTISIAVARADAETVFSVHSLGPEIPPSDRDRIFERYFRSSALSNRASGTGIGLAVAKRAAQMHGGHVWVSSGESQGTTFFAAIPTTVLERSTS